MAIESLCRRAIHGDLEAEASLIKQTTPKIREFLMRTVWDKDSVDDLLQDILEVATQKLRSKAIRRPAMFLSYVRGISRHLVVSYIRSKQREAGNANVDDVGEWILAKAHDAETKGPLQHLLAVESTESMLSRIGQLPRPRDRRVLIGHYFEGSSPRDLARELKIKEAHVYRVLHRARNRLEKLL